MHGNEYLTNMRTLLHCLPPVHIYIGIILSPDSVRFIDYALATTASAKLFNALLRRGRTAYQSSPPTHWNAQMDDCGVTVVDTR